MGSNPGSCIVDFFVSFHVLVLLVVSCRSGVLCVAAQSRHRQKTISFPPLLSPSSMAPCSLVPASSVLLRLGVAGSDSRCQFQAEAPAWPPAHSVLPIGSGIRDVAIGGGGIVHFPPPIVLFIHTNNQHVQWRHKNSISPAPGESAGADPQLPCPSGVAPLRSVYTSWGSGSLLVQILTWRADQQFPDNPLQAEK